MKTRKITIKMGRSVAAALICVSCCTVVLSSCDNDDYQAPPPKVYWGYFEGKVNEVTSSLKNTAEDHYLWGTRKIEYIEKENGAVDSVFVLSATIGLSGHKMQMGEESTILYITLHMTPGVHDLAATEYGNAFTGKPAITLKMSYANSFRVCFFTYEPSKDAPVSVEVFNVNTSPDGYPILEARVKGTFYSTTDREDSINIEGKFGIESCIY
ncbi:MAG: DUF5025 domain-containing protein [Odoribacteraceae bacterium]|jgi:hypothetical protein|nr:DUF5025 domain-containing protein [Odoribacteraceae bacterium]